MERGITMTLKSLWIEQRSQLEGKHVRQIISFAGDGKLRDDNPTSKEFREFLSQIPSEHLIQYLDECLSEKFEESGFVLQDIVNQIGKRLGFKVTDGRYRGTQAHVGYDGLWVFPDNHAVIVEVKTTDTYQINLEAIAKYRREIIKQEFATEENSSVLIVLGREDRDTTGLEAQIRGSRHAWNIRIISVDALVKLMKLKEDVEDPKIIQRISAILIPREFTKLDEIIDLVFFTAADVKEEIIVEQESDTESPGTESKEQPVSFHDACIKRLEILMQQSLLKRSRTTYSNSSDQLRTTCAVSKEYDRGGQLHYWFAFHPHQKEFLEKAQEGFVTFGCGTEETLVVIPFIEWSKWLDNLHTTDDGNRFYWHVNIAKTEDGSLFLVRKKGSSRIKLNKFLARNLN